MNQTLRSRSWVTALYRAALRDRGVRWVYAVQGPAQAGYDSAENRDRCRHDGIQPHIRKIGEAHGSGLGGIRCVVEHGCAWLLANKRLDRRHDRRGHIILALLAAACIFIVANRLDAF